MEHVSSTNGQFIPFNFFICLFFIWPRFPFFPIVIYYNLDSLFLFSVSYSLLSPPQTMDCSVIVVIRSRTERPRHCGLIPCREKWLFYKALNPFHGPSRCHVQWVRVSEEQLRPRTIVLGLSCSLAYRIVLCVFLSHLHCTSIDFREIKTVYTFVGSDWKFY
jgi:hypothetical protein